VRWLVLSFAIFLCHAEAQNRIASLNMEKKHGPELLAEIDKQPDLRKADILLLQEVVDGPSFHTAAEVASRLKLNFVFAPAFRLDPDFEEGLAILSRFPLDTKTVIPLSHNSVHFHTRIRIALVATVRTPAGPWRVMDVHLDNRVNADAKRQQLEELWPETAKSKGPFIIGGDFNSANFRWVDHVVPIPGVQSLNELVRKGMEDHGFKTPLGAGSATLHYFGIKLDWIYVRGLQTGESGVTRIPFSDHNSVWITAFARG
jgi:endonuclease/exonuclease/phosphatase family metal-dependent hydrolase